MSHLKCETHGRRVLVLQTAKGIFDHNSVLHRNDGSNCQTPTVIAGRNRHNPDLLPTLLHHS